MRTLQPANRVRVGALAIAVVVLVVGVGQSFSSLPMLFATASYYAQFSDSGGLSKGDKVRIVGMDVGTVQDVTIDGDHVVMKFSTGTHTIGTESRLAIKTDTMLGKKVLEIEPRGTQRHAPERRAAARTEHHPVSDLRRVLRRHQGRRRLEHRHRQEVAECVVAHH